METTHTVREVGKLVSAHKQREGGGFIVRRPFPSLGLNLVDIFTTISSNLV